MARLTYEDRRRIADGLKAGLSQADIARLLDRPRSTVTREIARNGGAHAYRAGRAQQATRVRARRRPGPPAVPVLRDPAEVGAFAGEFAGMMVRTGMPPMGARVFAALFTADTGAATAPELVARLGVSPASVSKAVRWLAERELIRRERGPADRRERYVIDEDVWYRAWIASAQANTVWADFARRGAAVLGPGTPAGGRFEVSGRFFELLAADMARAAEHWRRTLTAPTAPAGSATSRRSAR